MSHHHHVRPVGGKGVSLLVICVVIKLLFVAGEAFTGIYSNSSALLSDAGHNLSDVLGLLLSLLAILFEKRRRLRAFSPLLTFLNGMLLIVTVAVIAADSIQALSAPLPVKGGVVVLTAALGVIVNGVTVWLLLRNSGENINIRVAYLHALSDMLVSAGVVVSGLVVSVTGFDIVDPFVGICVSVSVLVPAAKLVANALRMIKNG